MKKFIFLLFIIINRDVYSQLLSSFGVSMSPIYSYSKFSSDWYSPFNTSNYGLRFGLNYQRIIKNKSSLGIEFNIEKLDISSPKLYLNDTSKSIQEFNIQYYEIPLYYQYSIIKKNRLFFNVGISNRLKSSIFGNTEKNILNVLPFYNIGILTGIGYEVKLAEHFFISFELRHRLNITNQLNSELNVLHVHQINGILSINDHF